MSQRTVSYLSYANPALKHRKRTPQCQRDYEKIQRRIKFNGEKVEYVASYIDRYFGSHVTSMMLISIANVIIEKHKIKLDRLARRNRSALLCWFTENWDIIHPYLKEKKSKSGDKSDESNNEFDDQNGRCIYKCEEYCGYFDPSDISLLLNTHMENICNQKDQLSNF
ncbi:hypothetical protein TVAG_151160 [Trichomonas vaginalis G3]|uniref:Uncharacterized protein n=1 Tax=Trichomonas vaginalis (strain ATCC PRA-98 / G3) TaxID=412133 RepID=A2GBU8_TRIV3|nr:hypothetical protein TVAGG3_0618870 [Trichomonas vaginalis G3]EAX85371.1 hypothetical protein TVAG_151160 [Trichomonas vaginalis G3]KAI5503753.1 hypothetical protein TVAGG3_0618870 [Trichomonas vaginalis G3]|eukprot:XP_001298301.1 hypothetical protein [Trichomonas vaginalis G3]